MGSIKPALLVVASLLILASAQAALITYTFTADVRGEFLDANDLGDPFAGSMTVVIKGDTVNVQPYLGDPNILRIDTGLTNVITFTNKVGPSGSSSITDGGLYVFNNQKNEVVGFGSGNHSDLLALGPDASLATYDLVTNFGPLFSAVPFFDQFDHVQLANGIRVTLGDATNATFTAVTAAAAVPEPGTLVLFGAALAGIGLARRRRLK